MSRWAPKRIKAATCQQVVRLGRDVNLWDLPVPRCWPGESDPVITSGQIVTCHPTTGQTTIFNSPLVVTAQSELAIYDGACDQRDLINAAIESQRNLPVAIVLGSDPVVALAASLPGMSDPRLFAGLLRGASLEQVRCRSNELEVPAAAEIIIEGYLDAANPRSSKALSVARGNGRYVRRELPIIQVTAITHRANPVFPATVVSSTPPGEESWTALATERMSLPLLKRLLPEIVDIHQPFSGAGRNLLFVSIRTTIEHQARRVLHAIWGMENFGQTKTVVIVDADIDVKCEDLVWFTVGNNACPSRDFLFSDGLARDDDYTPLTPTMSSRIGIDATRKKDRESSFAWPDTLEMSQEIVEQVAERWSEYGLDR
ncbi:MAG: UbiD family decarboxylase domain-containing protein [Schlesneria sp.]